MNVLDQNQVAHRRLVFDRIPAWFEVDHYASDGEFFRAVSRVWSFCGIDRVVGYERRHGLDMQATKDQSTGRRE